MGEAAEMLLDGTMCETCGEYIGDSCGYSRSCCDEDHPSYLTEMDKNGDEKELDALASLDVLRCAWVDISLAIKGLQESHPDSAKNLSKLIPKIQKAIECLAIDLDEKDGDEDE